MSDKERIIAKSFFIFFTASLLVSAKVQAADDISQFGFGTEGLNRFSENSTSLDFEKEYETISVDDKSKKESVAPALQIDVEYHDKTAGLSSPHHSFNTELNNRLNNSSNELKTRMGYRLGYITPEASFNYSPDSYGFGKYYNYELGVAVPVKDIFSVETRYGWNKFDKKAEQGGLNNYQDWSVGVSTTYKGVKLKVDYIDVNAGEKSEECGQLFPCEGKTVFSIIKNF